MLKADNQIKCKTHKYFVQALDTRADQDNIFLCFKCLKEKNSMLYSLNFEEIQKAGQEDFFDHWPPFKDNQNQILQVLKVKTENSKMQDRIQETIMYFDQLKKEIIEMINEQLKRVLLYYQSVQEGEQNIISLYNQMSQKKELQELINQLNLNNVDEIKQKLKEIVKKCHENSQQNDYQLNNAILKNNQLILQIEQTQKNLCNQLCSNINQVFNKFQDKENKNQIENNSDHINLIIKLISNKSNFCKVEYIEALKKFFIQNLFQINKISYSNFSINNQDPINFNDLSNEQMNQIKDFIILIRLNSLNLVKYKFIKSQYGLSNKIQQLEGNIFSNSGGGFQSIQSEIDFSEGVHTFIYKIITLPKNYKHFYTVLGNNTDRKFYKGCICCMDGDFKGSNLGQILKNGSIIKFGVDFDNNKATITELLTNTSKTLITYQSLKHLNLRLGLCWSFLGENPEELQIQILYTD